MEFMKCYVRARVMRMYHTFGRTYRVSSTLATNLLWSLKPETNTSNKSLLLLRLGSKKNAFAILEHTLLLLVGSLRLFGNGMKVLV